MKAWYALVAFACGFAVAQLWKFVTGVVSSRKQEKRDFKEMVGYLMRSGGMPSGHTASFTAASIYIGYLYGFGSGIFALAACVWLVVVYDAIHVRYAVGEQGKALNKLLREAKQPELPVVEGHTMSQVVVGALIGAIIGVSMGVLMLS